MNLRTILAAAPAAALLALATCAEPPTPTAADPAGPGAEGSAVPSGPGGELAMANQSECRIESFIDSLIFIGPKDGRPHPDSAATVAVAEGTAVGFSPIVYWYEGNCPVARLHLEFDTVFGLYGTPEPEPDDFELWRGTGYVNHVDNDRPYWLVTYRPFVKKTENYEVRLELVQYVDGYRLVHARRTDWAGWGPPGQKCWAYRESDPFRGQWLRDTEACKLPLKVLSWFGYEEAE